ncbi:MAG: TlpA disulfide reductase family protein, partial [Chrysiogenales bacterium]
TIALFSLAVCCQARESAEKLPDFKADDISGRTLKLSDFKGKIVLLDFWATWCPPCRVEIPNLLEIYRQFKNKNFVLLSVSLDRDIPLARQFVKEKEMNWLHIIDRESASSIAALYEIEFIPATFIIDGKGKIVARNLRGAELKNTIAKLLK